MVSADDGPQRRRDHLEFLRAAEDAGVKHVVYTSIVGASPDPEHVLAHDHWVTEEFLRASAMAFTILRDGLYMDFMQGLVGVDGVIRGPAGDGKAALVARVDIARVAATVLRNPSGHQGMTYVLTGPEAIGLAEVARLLSVSEGRPISYVAETKEQAYESRRRLGASDAQIDSWLGLYRAIGSGALSEVSPDIERLTGRPATSMAAFLGGEATTPPQVTPG